MYCPECGVAYRPGFTECSDCHVVLVEQPPAGGEPPRPDLDLVRILEGNSPVAAAVVKTVLETAAIPFFMEGEDAAIAILCGDPHLHRWWAVEVARDHEAEARQLLENAVAPEDLEIDIDQEPVEIADDCV